MNFFITGLPRSRTAWFAAYFTALGKTCLHEGLNGLHSRQEFTDLMSVYDGNSDCGLLLTDFQDRFPEARTVIIWRDNHSVSESMARVGMPVDQNALSGLKRNMMRLKGLHVGFHEIDDRLEEITNYCGVEYNPVVANLFMNVNVSIKHITSDPKSLKVWVN